LQKHGCAYLSELTSRYGRIVNFPLPGIRGVLVADKDLVKQVLLKTERGFYKGKIYDLLTPVVGRGLVTNQGASWRKRRLLLKPMFQPSALSELDPILDSCCQKLFAQIEQSIDQRRPLDTTASMMELTFSVLIRSFFSGDLTSHYQELAGAFAQLQAWIGHRFWAPIRLPPNWPTPRNRQFHKAMDYLRAAVLDLIRQRRSRPSRQGGDLLDRILVARDAETGSPLTEQELIDEIITMLIAGHDTTALTLSFTCALLAEHPIQAAKLVSDLSRGHDAEAILLPYIYESMRLYPAVYMINRNNSEPFGFGSYEFPAHTTFFVSQYAVHRDPEYWPDPMNFQPERFAAGVPDDFRFFPFAGGHRTCIGNHLAMKEAVGVLARLLPHFVPRRLCQPFRLMANLTSIPQPGVTLEWGATKISSLSR